MDSFDELVAPYAFDWKLKGLVPEVLSAKDDADVLSESGALGDELCCVRGELLQILCI
ncbi:hypothetical protein ACWG0P_02170 [Amedibacillus sp. YH-ame6]